MGKCVGIGQCGKLVRRSLCQSFLGESKRYAPQACKPFQIPIILVIPDVHPFSAGNDQRALFLVGGQVGVGVQGVGDIFFMDVGNSSVHLRSPF